MGARSLVSHQVLRFLRFVTEEVRRNGQPADAHPPDPPRRPSAPSAAAPSDHRGVVQGPELVARTRIAHAAHVERFGPRASGSGQAPP